MRQKYIHLLAVLAALFLAPAIARAESVLTLNSFSFDGGVVGSSVMAFDPFDPSLGTLDEVRVTISGSLAVFGQASGVESYSINHDFFGLGWSLFEFNSPAVFQGTAALPGVLAASHSFDYTITFNDVTDLIGFAVINGGGDGMLPPTGVTAQRSDFVPSPIFQLQTIATVGSGPVTNIIGGGLVLIEYQYTPGAVVPAPLASLGGAALLGMIAMRRRRIG